MTIRLKDIWKPRDLTEYKVHFAVVNPDEKDPIISLLKGGDEWAVWNSFKPEGQDTFNRRCIFSMARVPGTKDLWLFGGVFIVKGKTKGADGRECYDIELSPILADLAGTMVIKYGNEKGKFRNARPNLEAVFEEMMIVKR